MLQRDPTKCLSTGTHAGFAYAVLHNGMGYRCGYVAVPKDHPWFGKDYDDIGDDGPGVHGGLTYADADSDGALWWLGFDCAHSDDAADPTLPSNKPLTNFPGYREGTVRTTEYVEQECRSLCEQARAALPATVSE